jgi:hypothetical protein
LILETKMMIKSIMMSIFILHIKTQDIVKHGLIFKHENSLLASHNAWKIFMKLDPKPFETLFLQVMRLERNTNELKDSIFQFLRSDKG